MHQTITHHSQFHDAFVSMDRGNQFSREGFRALFEFFEEYEQMTGESVELDVIAICCDYTEDTVEGIIQNYSIDVSGFEEYDRDEMVSEWLQNHTTVVGIVGNSIVYANF
jgi:hypothetical protein